jgi:UDPglucose--hexose-1-phosphate uridylyltransferase
MPELRQNIATKEWVIISTERASRPNTYAEAEKGIITDSLPPYDPLCPFCPGNEELDLEVERIPPGATSWQVRTVYNRYPALHKREKLNRTFNGVQRWISGVGHHEVLVEHPKHNTTLAFMTPTEIAVVLEMFYNRGWDIQSDPRIEQVIYFKNHGTRAGASLVHPHSQIIGLPVVPNHIRQRTEEARRYFDDTGDCVYCVMLNDELSRGERLVTVSEYFAAFVLYAAPSPFHTWIVPRRHSISFLYTDKEEREDLANVLYTVLHRLFAGLGDPAYNFIIRSAPVKELNSDYLHWYLTLVPRLKRTAGFELGSGMFINPTLPEECAAFLRELE